MKTTRILACALLACASSATWAQKAGTWSASVGITHIAPDVTSGVLTGTPGATIDVNSNTQITGAVNYAFTDNLALHFPLGFGFKHKLSGTGFAAGAGVLATTKALPITVIGQYRFGAANATLRPYVGGGLAYTMFNSTKGTAALTSLTNLGGVPTTLKLANKLSPVIQLGASYSINERWYVDGSYTKLFLKTRATLSTGQTQDATLNPDGFTFQVGYKF